MHAVFQACALYFEYGNFQWIGIFCFGFEFCGLGLVFFWINSLFCVQNFCELFVFLPWSKQRIFAFPTYAEVRNLLRESASPGLPTQCVLSLCYSTSCSGIFNIQTGRDDFTELISALPSAFCVCSRLCCLCFKSAFLKAKKSELMKCQLLFKHNHPHVFWPPPYLPHQFPCIVSSCLGTGAGLQSSAGRLLALNRCTCCSWSSPCRIRALMCFVLLWI